LVLGLREYALLSHVAVIAAFVTACLAYELLVLPWPLRYAVARDTWQPIGE